MTCIGYLATASGADLYPETQQCSTLPSTCTNAAVQVVSKNRRLLSVYRHGNSFRSVGFAKCTTNGDAIAAHAQPWFPGWAEQEQMLPIR